MNINQEQQNQSSKRKKLKKFIYMIISFVLSLIISGVGIVLYQKYNLNGNVLHGCGIACSVFILLLIPINIFLNKKHQAKLSGMNAREIQNYYVSQRENADKSAKRLSSKLKRIRFFTYFYIVFIILCSVFIAFTSNMGNDHFMATPMLLLSMSIINVLFIKLQKPYTKKDIDENDSYVNEKDFPKLYELAKKARDTVGCKGEVRIAILPDNNAGIANIDSVFSVQLGALMLNTLDEKEVYCVLLHEFSHMVYEKDSYEKEVAFATKIYAEDYSEVLFPFAGTLFIYLNALYYTNYDLFRYASTISAEANADKAMCKSGDKLIAASSLIKLKYHEFYIWELGTYDEKNVLENEDLPKTFHTDECESFKKKIEENKDRWNTLIGKEIISQSATHPTTKMRIEALGVSEIQTVSTISSKEFISEGKKSLEFCDSLWQKYNKELFEEHRKEYIKSVETVEKWRKNGCPVIMEEYRFIVQALRHIGNNVEAMTLCDRVIEELTETEANFAYYLKGNYLIHKYDSSGIQYIYKSMSNHNYIDEGLDMIGHFCCLMGMQEELESYREKAIELIQKQMDEFSKLGELTPKDNLSTETLPNGMLEEILQFISKIEEGNIEKIYLVKKTISENFSTSVFVIKFTQESNPTKNDEIMDKIFNYLDTFSDKQFSLFDYLNVRSVKLDEIPSSVVYAKE